MCVGVSVFSSVFVFCFCQASVLSSKSEQHFTENTYLKISRLFCQTLHDILIRFHSRYSYGLQFAFHYVSIWSNLVFRDCFPYLERPPKTKT